MAGGKTFKRDQKRRKEMERKLRQDEKLRKKQERRDSTRSRTALTRTRRRTRPSSIRRFPSDSTGTPALTAWRCRAV